MQSLIGPPGRCQIVNPELTWSCIIAGYLPIGLHGVGGIANQPNSGVSSKWLRGSVQCDTPVW